MKSEFRIIFAYETLVVTKKLISNFKEIVNQMKGIICNSEIIVVLPRNIGKQNEELIKKQISADYMYIVGSDEDYDMTLLDYKEVVLDICKKYNPDCIYVSANLQGRSLASWLGTKLNAGVVADAIQVEYDSNKKQIYYIRATANNGLLSKIICMSKPQVASLRPHEKCNILEDTDTECKTVKLNNSKTKGYFRSLEIKKFADNYNIFRSDIVIGVGRGVSEDCLKKVYKFANRYNISVMCSKPLVDQGVFPYSHQIGQSGTSIHAKYYIAVGISGMTQHIVGIINCKNIIAINPNEAAPINEVANIVITARAEEIFHD